MGKWMMSLLLVAGLVFAFWDQVVLGFQLVLGGGVLAFLLAPIVRKIETFISRKWAVLSSVIMALCIVVLLVVMVLPPMVKQLTDLIGSMAVLSHWAGQMAQRLSQYGQSIGFSALDFAHFDYLSVMPGMNTMIGDAVGFAGSLIGAAGQAMMSLMLGIYFMLDKESILLTMELMVPLRIRGIVLRMAGEAGRGLYAYLRGQLLVSLIVGSLAFVGFMITGIRSPLALGAMVGALNMIPYFGPIIGGVPVVLAALTQDVFKVMTTVSVLFVVQQLDGMFISPRVMSGVTGLSPAAVLIALTLGASAFGILGMMTALPLVLVGRICFRVWAGRNE